ncbi:hypothetical protein ACA910_018392 [Epithemia clementina (nom. ined.)]
MSIHQDPDNNKTTTTEEAVEVLAYHDDDSNHHETNDNDTLVSSLLSPPPSSCSSVPLLHDPESAPSYDHCRCCSKPAKRPSCLRNNSTTTTATTSTTTTTPQKCVSFDRAEIHYHPTLFGDNPACSTGYPLTIDWKEVGEPEVVDLTTITLEEDVVAIDKPLPVPLPAWVREQRLRQAGYSKGQMVRLNKAVNVARAQRQRTLDTLHLAPLHQAWQCAKKRVGLCLTFTLAPQKRHERRRLKLWQAPVANRFLLNLTDEDTSTTSMGTTLSNQSSTSATSAAAATVAGELLLLR